MPAESPSNAPSEQRRHPRYWVDLPVLFRTSSTHSEGLQSGTVFNLSQGGCAVATLSPLPVGEILTLFVQTTEGKVMVTVDKADVRWSTASEFGLRFQGLDPDDQNRLQRYLSSHS